LYHYPAPRSLEKRRQKSRFQEDSEGPLRLYQSSAQPRERAACAVK
jgi:hypothetical protein